MYFQETKLDAFLQKVVKSVTSGRSLEWVCFGVEEATGWHFGLGNRGMVEKVREVL